MHVDVKYKQENDNDTKNIITNILKMFVFKSGNYTFQ